MEELEYGFDIDFSNATIDRNIPTISITNVLDTLERPFDRDAVAEKTFNKHYNNPESEYYHMTIEQIIDKWSAKGAESCHYGSMLDDYIGTILTGNDNDLKLFKLNNAYDYDERLHGLCDSFDNFYSLMMKSGDMVFVDRERDVYLKTKILNPITNNEEDYYIKGRFDALFFSLYKPTSFL